MPMNNGASPNVVDVWMDEVYRNVHNIADQNLLLRQQVLIAFDAFVLGFKCFVKRLPGLLQMTEKCHRPNHIYIVGERGECSHQHGNA